MDTTWSVMQNYVTAILVAISHNTAVLLACAFGPIESFELYDNFYQIFKSKYDIDLAQFTVESDQGSGLKKYCEKHNIVHRFWLRHFLASVGDHLFGCYVQYLVKSVSQDEFNVLSAAFCEPLQKAINGGCDRAARLTLARREFRKAGLAIDESDGKVNSIYIDKPDRWAQVCVLQKITDELPSTTNALESKDWTFADFLRASLLSFPSDDQTLITPINISDGWIAIEIFRWTISQEE
jgi:hypothetical protein